MHRLCVKVLSLNLDNSIKAWLKHYNSTACENRRRHDSTLSYSPGEMSQLHRKYPLTESEAAVNFKIQG